MPQTIFTIGHSNLTFLKFLSLIQANQINHVIDIRSIPYSKYAPWSNKSRLQELLRPFNIRYTYLGHHLGGKNQTRSPDIQENQNKDVYSDAIQILIQLSLRDNLTLLCAEGDPNRCHRQHLISQTLLQSGVNVIHILKDGSLQEAWQEDPPAHQPNLF
jgi:uncharacterized protein (DUF488 family)